MKLKKLVSLVDEVLAKIPIDFGGGSSSSKVTLMAWLILHEKIDASIDVGIYRGRSFFPQALAHKLKGSGKVVGIDPYLKSEALEHDNKALKKAIIKFVDNTDFQQLYKQVMSWRNEWEFSGSSSIMRTTSNKAFKDLKKKGKSFGLIHIDGNHDEQAVLQDLRNAFEVLKDKGFIVMDDISWTSVKPAVDLAMNELGMHLLYCRVDSMNDFNVLQKGGSRPKRWWLRSRLGAFSDF